MNDQIKSLIKRKDPHTTMGVCAGLGILTYYIFYFNFGEQYYSHFGLQSFDSAFYFNLTKNFSQILINKELSLYEAQRIFPSFLLHTTLHALSIPPTDLNIIRIYDVYSILIFCASFYVWYCICRLKSISVTGYAIGIIGLFINAPLLKIFLYQPITTDSSAFLLGITLLYFHLKRNKSALMITIAISSITWPSALFSGLTLYLFSNIYFTRKKSVMKKERPTFDWALFLSVSCAIICICISASLFYFYKYKPPNGSAPVIASLALLSLFLLGSYTLTTSYNILTHIEISWHEIKRILSSIRLRNLMICVIVFICTRFLLQEISNLQTGPLSFKDYIKNIFITSIVSPLKFLVAHTSFFGPVIVLFIFYWKSMCNKLIEQDIGFIAFFGIALIQGIGSESRQLIFAYPFFIFILVKSINDLKIKRAFLWTLLFFALFFSRFWYTINQEAMPNLNNPFNVLLFFPWQHFMMFHGPWISFPVYLVMAVIFIFTSAYLYWWHIRPTVISRASKQ
jgi:hypothetical protein